MAKKGIATDKNILVFYSNTNVRGRKDATGAFIPEAEAFARLHSIPKTNVIGIKLPRVNKEQRRREVLNAIKRHGHRDKIGAIAFFGHGWPNGIQFGFDRKHIPELVVEMTRTCTPDVKVMLFACLAAENDSKIDNRKIGPGTDGGFCDRLRDEMARYGLGEGRVDGHLTAGHTSWNPYLVRFLCTDVFDHEYGATGGAYVVAPRSQLWRKWITALKNQKGGMRYRFPFMDEIDIKAELMNARIIEMEPTTIEV